MLNSIMPAPAETAADAELIPENYFRVLRREEIFPDSARPLEIDVGCGDGTFLLKMAEHCPERDFLGIERLNGRVAKIRRGARRLGLTNVRVLSLESRYALEWLLPEGLADRVHLLFADPWPKKRHAARRFMQPEGLAAIHRALKPGGEFLFKTDDEPYFAEGAEATDASPLFSRLPWLDDGEFYPVTDFEQQWITAGRLIQSARWRRR